MAEQPVPGSQDDLDADWSVASLDGAASRRAGIVDLLQRQNLPEVLGWGGTRPAVWTRDGQWILFAGAAGDGSNLYRVRVSGETGVVAGEAERITFGTGVETKPALGAGGQLALATEVLTSQLWSVPADTNQGKITGDMTQLTREATRHDWPQISEDGRKVLYRSEQAQGGRAFLLDLESGAQKPLAPGRNIAFFTSLVRGGTRIVFSDLTPDKGPKGHRPVRHVELRAGCLAHADEPARGVQLPPLREGASGGHR